MLGVWISLKLNVEVEALVQSPMLGVWISLKLKVEVEAWVQSPMLGVWISLKLKEPVDMPLPTTGDESAAAAAPLAGKQ